MGLQAWAEVSSHPSTPPGRLRSPGRSPRPEIQGWPKPNQSSPAGPRTTPLCRAPTHSIPGIPGHRCRSLSRRRILPRRRPPAAMRPQRHCLQRHCSQPHCLQRHGRRRLRSHSRLCLRIRPPCSLPWRGRSRSRRCLWPGLRPAGPLCRLPLWYHRSPVSPRAPAARIASIPAGSCRSTPRPGSPCWGDVGICS